ncbi:MAG: PGF-CTERM sorting domain-containing protein [Halobacteriota archaeon]
MRTNKGNLGFLALIGLVLIGVVVLSGSIDVCRGDGKEWPNLLPLSEGNEWEYKITVPPDGDFYYFNEILYPSKRRASLKGRFLPDPGEYSLKFVVTDEIEESEFAKYWKIRVEKDSLGMYSRRDIESVWWGYLAGTSGKKGERLEYKPEKIREKGRPFSVTTLLFENPDVSSIEEGFEGKPPYFYLKCFPDQVVASVPAGRFSNCWIFVQKIPVAKEFDINNFSPSLGFQTYSYYAPNVGLVKQYQEDSEGHRLYTMELVSYKIAAPVPTLVPTPIGFEVAFTIAGLLAVAYLFRKRKMKER